MGALSGKGIANPMATILAGAMMLHFLGEPEASHRLESTRGSDSFGRKAPDTRSGRQPEPKKWVPQ
jgi:isocitrate/isopropylmalate dehydrogenase